TDRRESAVCDAMGSTENISIETKAHHLCACVSVCVFVCLSVCLGACVCVCVCLRAAQQSLTRRLMTSLRPVGSTVPQSDLPSVGSLPSSR
uniref:Uncharacterized protein n=1 Tax=Oreochromis aureus TaxID=47969 RepID=A0AAZ1XLG3_OREAU